MVILCQELDLSLQEQHENYDGGGIYVCAECVEFRRHFARFHTKTQKLDLEMFESCRRIWEKKCRTNHYDLTMVLDMKYE